jgi:carbon-monoxide dehydrogenase medium subunit
MPFDYHEPQTLSEAFRLLASEGEAGAILAGGTDLLLQMRRRVRSYRSVINIKAIPGLNELRYDPAEGLTCGALVTFRELETDPAVRLHYPALSEAAALVAGVQLRNLATVGGNVGNASPAADSIPPLVALGATSEIAGPGGSRNVSLDECFVGPGKTILAADELFTVFHIPPPPANSGNVYQRLTPRSAMDIAVVSVAATVQLDGSRRVTDCRIVLGAVAPVPLRAAGAEAVLRGNAPSPALLKQAGEIAAQETRPITDMRGSAAYRRAMIAVLTGRVVELAAQRARGAASPAGHFNGSRQGTSQNGSTKASS